jgi:hypothetical protein
MKPRSMLAALLSATILAGLPAMAQADENKEIGLTGFADILVDQSHGHVFITQDNATIVVTDLDGSPITTIGNMYGAQGMVLSDDGATLYVGLSDGDGIAAIDTVTLAATAHGTGTSTCPGDLAFTSGQVWFSSVCGAGLRALDPSDWSVSGSLANLSDAVIEASPAYPDQLFAMQRGISPGTLYAYTTVGGATPSATVRTSRWNVGSNGRDLALTPDAGTVITASGAPYEHPAFKTTDLSGAGVYGSSYYPNAVAVREDGMVAAGISGYYQPDVYLYQPGSTTLFRSYEFGGTDNELLPGGLAFSSTRLYAVSADLYTHSNYRLHVLTTRNNTDLSIGTDRKAYRFDGAATVTAGLPVAMAGRTISIYAEPFAGARRLVASGPVDADGRLTATVRVTQRTRFVAEYAGDQEFEPKSASTTVTAAAKTTATMLDARRRSGKYYLYRFDRSAIIKGAVSPNHGGDCLKFRWQFYSGRWRSGALTSCVPMTAQSSGRFLLRGHKRDIGVKFRLRAEWPGDMQNTKQNSPWRYVKFVR